MVQDLVSVTYRKAETVPVKLGDTTYGRSA